MFDNGIVNIDRAQNRVQIGRAQPLWPIVSGEHAVDHSTNGTYVCLEGEQPVLVKHESFLLRGRGLLGIGEAFSAPACGAIEFACSVR